MCVCVCACVKERVGEGGVNERVGEEGSEGKKERGEEVCGESQKIAGLYYVYTQIVCTDIFTHGSSFSTH